MNNVIYASDIFMFLPEDVFVCIPLRRSDFGLHGDYAQFLGK